MGAYESQGGPEGLAGASKKLRKPDCRSKNEAEEQTSQDETHRGQDGQGHSSLFQDLSRSKSRSPVGPQEN